ncbi:MAG: ABC transporter permease [Desulfurococcaceae archaeon]
MGNRNSFYRNNTMNILYVIKRNSEMKAGLIITCLFIVLALIAPYIAPYGVYDTDPSSILKPPSFTHLFGTDEMGRDLFSLNLYALKSTLLVGILSAVISSTIGLFMGILSGYFSGILDWLITRVVDFLISIPAIVLMIVMGSVFSSGVLSIILIIAILSWAPIARVIRSIVLSVKELPFVQAAKALGASDLWIIRKHILPSVLPMTLVLTILSIPNAIFSYAALVFMGVGSVDELNLGTILYYAYVSGSLSSGRWWYFIPPGLILVTLAIGIMLVGRALEKELNPRLRESKPEPI